jgi:hypothetical protein
MTPHGIPKEEKNLKNTVSRKHHGYVILVWVHVVILVSLLPIDAETNCGQSHEALRSLNACFRLGLFTREISETLPLHGNIRPRSNVSTTEDTVPAHCLKSWSRTTLYSSVRSFERQPARTKLHSLCGTAVRRSPVAAAKGRRICRAGLHAFAQRLKKNFSADGDHIEIEVRLLQIVLKFYDISKCVTSK